MSVVSDPVREGVPCLLMRGGTSKGAYFLADDLPSDPVERDDLLLRIMGSPDPRQIDGLGGGDPLTSKVAVVRPSDELDIDVEYLFLQVSVDEAHVSASQTCGNLLAGIGPFAVERGLVPAADGETAVRIRLVNTGGTARATFGTDSGGVVYAGDTVIDGVPGASAGIALVSQAVGPLLPTGHVVDEIAGHRVTLIDNGMPVVLVNGAEFGVQGDESPEVLEGDGALTERLEVIRRAAGPRMGLGDVSDQTVPKMFLLTPPRAGGAIGTRAFIPHRVHRAIGVLMAASVAAAVRIPGTVAEHLAAAPGDGPVAIEHPGGVLHADVRAVRRADGSWEATAASQRTARRIFDGRVYPRPSR